MKYHVYAICKKIIINTRYGISPERHLEFHGEFETKLMAESYIIDFNKDGRIQNLTIFEIYD
jgi:hypothetical protein